MAAVGWRARAMLIVRGATDRFPGDLVAWQQRRARRAVLSTLGAYVAVVVVGLALVASRTAPWPFAGAMAGWFGAAIVPLWVLVWWDRRGIGAVPELLAGADDVSAQQWEALDGGGQPTTREEALARLGERSDDLAVALRISIQWYAARDRARTQLAAWYPLDPVFRARRERFLSADAFDTAGTDDTRAAQAAAAGIEDVEARRTQLTFLAMERARRVAIGGGDPFPLLVKARRDLADVDLAIRPSLRSRAGYGVLGLVLYCAHTYAFFWLAGLLAPAR